MKAVSQTPKAVKTVRNPRVTYYNGRRYAIVGIEGRVITLQRCDDQGNPKPKGRIVKIVGTLKKR